MAEPSSNELWRWISVGLSAVAAIWLIFTAVTHEWAFHEGNSENPAAWQKAAEIEPGNSDNWYRLGRYRHLDFNHADLPQAIAYYRRAWQLDPLSPFYKLDLAGALELENQNAEADRYYREAQHDYPISAEVSWRYGNFLLRQQRLPEAYAELYRAVSVDPNLLSSVISRAWRANPDVDALIQQLLHNRPDWDWQVLSFFLQANNGPAGLRTWNYLAGQKAPPDWGEVNSLIDLLLFQAFYDDADSVWRQALSISGTPAQQANGSLIFDGGFEQNLSGGGFGWRLQDVAGASFDFDSDDKHSGARAARITFDGTQNLPYQNLWQEVLVQPGTHYHFSGFLHTKDVSTNSGLRFEIRDRGNTLDVLTPNITGTEPWMEQDADFTTGPQTRIVQVDVKRLPSERFDNKIRGTVWIDDVALVPVAPAK